MESLNKDVKSFWERPEGTTGMLFLALGAAGLYFALPTLLTFMAGLVTLVGQTITLVIMGTFLTAFLYVVTNKSFRTLFKYGFKSAMRWITGKFVEIDPIGIMRSYISDLEEKRDIMASGRDKLSGQIRTLEKKIQENDKKYENAMSMVRVAKDQGKSGVMSVNARQAGRMEKLNEESFKPLLTQLVMHKKAIEKYYEVTGTMIDDLKNEVDARQVEREMILASYSAMSAAKKILKGGTDERELFDRATEFVQHDFGMKMGEIDAFIESSRGFVESLDLQNGVYEAAALEKLQAWEKKADSILLGGAAKHALMDSSSPTIQGLQVGAPVLNFDELVSTKTRIER